MKFEMVLLLDISKCGKAIDDDMEITDDMEFPVDAYVEIKDVIEEPETLYLEQGNCLETENISSSGLMHDYGPNQEWEQAYMTCPDCGKPIGLWNDGGNGFCTECAPEH